MCRTSLMIAILVGSLMLLLPMPAAGAEQEAVDWSYPELDVADWDEEWDEAWAREQGDVDQDPCLASPRLWRDLIEFCYRDQGFAGVSILGDFNGWEPQAMELDEEDGLWRIRLDLEPGIYHYCFRGMDSEGPWEAIDPGNSAAKKLEDRGWVSVLDLDDDFLESQGRRPGRWFRIERELGRGYEDEDFTLGYQRVDGLILAWMPDHHGERDWEPSARGKAAYGFKSEEWSLGLTLLQPIAPGNRLWLRLDGYTGTDFTDQTGIGYEENSLGAVFFKSDFRDYYKREGAAASVVASALPWLRVEGGMRSEDYRSLSNSADWSFHKGDFRPNPAVDEGTLRSAFGRLFLGDEDHHLALDYEQSGEDVMGGDFRFAQLSGQYRAILRLGQSEALSLRVKAGSNLSGELPRQKRYFLGGLGTVRGYPYQSLLVRGAQASPSIDPAPAGGERMLLANLEYVFGLFDDDLQFALLGDAGMAWEDRKADMDLDELKSSAGIGVLLDDGDLRLSLMKGLDDKDRDPVLELRLQRMF